MDRVKLRQNVANGDAELLMKVSQQELDDLTDAILEANRKQCKDTFHELLPGRT